LLLGRLGFILMDGSVTWVWAGSGAYRNGFPLQDQRHLSDFCALANDSYCNRLRTLLTDVKLAIQDNLYLPNILVRP